MQKTKELKLSMASLQEHSSEEWEAFLKSKLSKMIERGEWGELLQFGYRFDLPEHSIEKLMVQLGNKTLSLDLGAKALFDLIWSRAQQKSKTRKEST